MSICQLNVFVENKLGRLARLTALLTEAKINVRGFAVSDTGDFGIVRLVVDKPDEASQLLQAAGLLVNTTELLCLELPDCPGALNAVIADVAAVGVNLEYGYSLVSTYVAFRVPDVVWAEEQLKEQNLRIVDQAELSRPLDLDCD